MPVRLPRYVLSLPYRFIIVQGTVNVEDMSSAEAPPVAGRAAVGCLADVTAKLSEASPSEATTERRNLVVF